MKRNKNLDEHAHNIVAGIIETDRMDSLASYLSRGRSLSVLSEPDLQELWAKEFRAMVRGKGDATAFCDAASEIDLRHLEPNMSLVQDAEVELIAEMKRDQKKHPEGNPGVREAIRRYMDRRDRGMN